RPLMDVTLFASWTAAETEDSLLNETEAIFLPKRSPSVELLTPPSPGHSYGIPWRIFPFSA
ncbi:hypothetical protein, partial [Streptomyces sp. 1222.5]|uniref:hypothetical protein n=1 Tax=Streptomyces sp. 1222.5 TaxID=1881026 RepID=UPI003EBA02DE